MRKLIFAIALLVNFLLISPSVNAENWEEFTFLKTNTSLYAATLYYDKDSTYFDGEKIVTKLKGVDSHAPGAEFIINAYFVHEAVKPRSGKIQYLYSLYFVDKTDYYNGKFVASQKYKEPSMGFVYEPGLRAFIEIISYAGFDPSSLDEQYKRLKY